MKPDMGVVKDKRSEDKLLAYRPSIVTFIDILGFRSIVNQTPASEIYEIVKRVQRHAGSTDEDVVRKYGLAEQANWTRCVFFSDSIVRVRPFDAEYRDGSLFYEIIDLVHAQGELAFQGIFIRGGLTIGDIHQGSDVIFGPAMVRAFDLESSFANYPRIVIDPSVFKALRTEQRLHAEHHDVAQEMKYIKRLVRRGDDGLYYIDYLGAFRDEMDEPEAFPEYLAEVKKKIVSQAISATDNLSVLQKYLWMAKYLNAVAAKHTDCASESQVLITAKDIPEMSAFSSQMK
jgi:hypothetical protein